MSLSADVIKIIETLELEPHVEGGFYKRSYCSELSTDSENGKRALMSSIYYLLTADHPIGHWHKNRSDIMHYAHSGCALHYYLIRPDGIMEKHVLSNDLQYGLPQLLVPGGYWKATELAAGDYGLLSEAVSPGFDFDDMQLGKAQQLLQMFPQHSALIQRFSYQ